MKKRFSLIALTAAILLAMSSQLSAQAYMDDEEFNYNSIYLGYGLGSGPQIMTAIIDSLAFAFTTNLTGSKDIETRNLIGPIFAGGEYFLTENVAVGGLFSYDAFTRRWTYSDGGYADWNWSFISLMGRLNLQWGWDYVKFYHSLMIGGSRVGIDLQQSDGDNERSDAEYTWAGHLVLLGIKVGKDFSVFADVGFGYLGIVNIGASYAF